MGQKDRGVRIDRQGLGFSVHRVNRERGVPPEIAQYTLQSTHPALLPPNTERKLLYLHVVQNPK